jgi:hypothetical protein
MKMNRREDGHSVSIGKMVKRRKTVDLQRDVMWRSTWLAVKVGLNSSSVRSKLGPSPPPNGGEEEVTIEISSFHLPLSSSHKATFAET